MKGIQIAKEEIKQSLFTGDIIVFAENPNELPKTSSLLKLVSDSTKVKGYKVNYTKVNFFLYISNEQLEFEILENNITYNSI